MNMNSGDVVALFNDTSSEKTTEEPPGKGDSMRFYAGLCEPFPFEPTKDKFRVIDSVEMGQGVVALVDFEPGDIVFVFTGRVLTEQTLFTLQEAPGRYIEDPLVMGKVLHACDPNMVCDMTTHTYRACKPIRANDYLTMDYESTEDELFRAFDCQCSASSCRGHIRGRKYSPTLRPSFNSPVEDLPPPVREVA